MNSGSSTPNPRVGGSAHPVYVLLEKSPAETGRLRRLEKNRQYYQENKEDIIQQKKEKRRLLAQTYKPHKVI